MNKECGIKNLTTGLWLISVNTDGTYTWGDESNAICFDNESYQKEILGGLGEGFARGRPKRRDNE